MSVTLLIIILTVGVSLIADNNYDLKRKLLFNAFDIHHSNEWHRWLSHGFVHGGFFHLAINMYVFYMFGQAVESRLELEFEGKGRLIFLVLYLGGVVMSSVKAFFKHKDNPGYNSLGASGAVASVLFAFIMFYPLGELRLIIMPFFPIPAFLMGILYLWYESYMGKKGGTGIAHDAHFWGAVFGIAFILVLLPSQGIEFINEIIYYVQTIGQ